MPPYGPDGGSGDGYAYPSGYDPDTAAGGPNSAAHGGSAAPADPAAFDPGPMPAAQPHEGWAPTAGSSYPGAAWDAGGEGVPPAAEAPAHGGFRGGGEPDAATAGSGQPWSVPFAADDSGDESGEYSMGALVGQVQTAQGAPADGTPHAAHGDPAGHAGHDAAGVPGHDDGRGEHAAEPPTGAASPGSAQAAAEAGAGAEAQGAAPAHASDAEAEAGNPNDSDHPEPQPPGDGGTHSEHPTASYVLHVNGVDRPVTDAWLGESLLYVLRERLGLAGAKDGCEQGECGACSVQVDGRLIASCLMPAATAAGCEVRTVEGLAQGGQPSDVQRALAECGAVQCGFCAPGMAMTVHDLLEGNHRPSELETRQALCGNLCRCSGYQGVLEAVRQVVAERAAAAAEEADAEAAAAPQAGAIARIPHQSTGPDGGTV